MVIIVDRMVFFKIYDYILKYVDVILLENEFLCFGKIGFVDIIKNFKTRLFCWILSLCVNVFLLVI